jgi:hypothetical protein
MEHFGLNRNRQGRKENRRGDRPNGRLGGVVFVSPASAIRPSSGGEVRTGAASSSPEDMGFASDISQEPLAASTTWSFTDNALVDVSLVLLRIR